MRVLSLFSGVGGFDLGLERAGMEVVAQVEIDPFCQRVLERHWPDVRRYEDVRSVGLSLAGGDGRHLTCRDAGDVEQYASSGIDLICGGFPCQDLSVAGKRAGLDGARSGLWFEFQRIVSELRPKYVLVENVPGLLSSNQGRDFAVVLNGLGELGYAVSWAVLDARHFGVPQRRRRVFVVAGPTAAHTEAVLALAEGCAGHPAPGRAAGEDVAASLRSRSSRAGVNPPGRGGEDDSNLVTHSLTADGFDASEDGTGRGVPLVANTLGAKRDGGWRGDLDHDTYVPELAYAVAARNAKGVSLLESQDTFVVRTAQTGANGIGVQDDQAYTLDGTDGQAVAFHTSGYGGQVDDVAQPLQASDARLSNQVAGVIERASVRRLTPVECCRLQGFPDDWFAGNDRSDGPMYRALGNAVTVPVIEWIGRRLMALEGG